MARICRCGGTVVDKKIKVERNINGRRVVFKNVPASVCSNCSEIYFQSKTVKQMDRLAAKKEKDEIDFELDPRELRMLAIFETMKKNAYFSRRTIADKPINLSDIYILTEKLRHERIAAG